MRIHQQILPAIALGIILAAWHSGAEVITYTAPSQAKTSTDFKVTVNGQSLTVYKDHRYYFVVFSMSGDVTMNVTWTLPFNTAIVRPLSHKITPTVSGKSATFSFTGPRNISFESNDPFTNSQTVPALFIFANPPEVNVPSPDDPGVEYYGPGYHDIGEHSVTAAKKTIYIAGGAYLNGQVIINGVNDVFMYGRGILSTTYGDGCECSKRSSIFVNSCTGFRMQGITVSHNDTHSWTTVFRESSRAIVDNYHVVAYYINDDGFQPRADWCTFNNIFSATNDDCYSYSGGEHQTYLNCIARGGRARLFQIWKNAYFGFYKNCTTIGAQTSCFEAASVLFEGGLTDTCFRFENLTIEPKNYAIVLQGRNHYFKNTTILPGDGISIGNVESANTIFENLIIGGMAALNGQDARLNNIGPTPPQFIAADPSLPEVTITSPARAESCYVVTGPAFTLHYTIENWPMAPGGKGFRYFVNNVDQGLRHAVEPIAVSGLPIGPASINIKLVDETGTYTTVQDAIVVTVTNTMTAAPHQARRLTGKAIGPARMISIDGRTLPANQARAHRGVVMISNGNLIRTVQYE